MQFSWNTSDGSFSLSLLNEDNVMLLVFKPEDSKSEVIRDIMNYLTRSLKRRQKLRPEETDVTRWSWVRGSQLGRKGSFPGLALSLSPRTGPTGSPEPPRWPSPRSVPRLRTLRYSSKLWMVTGISFPPFFSSMLGNPGRVKSNPRSSTEQPFMVRVSNAYCRLSLV